MIGKHRRAIPEGYIPEGSTGPAPELISHETVCILNAGDEDASVEITVYFADREPAGPYEETVPAARTRHPGSTSSKRPRRSRRGRRSRA